MTQRIHRLDRKAADKVIPPWRGATWYYQGIYYTANGTPCDVKPDLSDEGFAGALKEAKTAYSYLPLKVKKATSKTKEPPRGSDETPPNPNDDQVDLIAWGIREADYPFGKVRKAIADRFSIKAMSETHAREILVKEDLITMEESGLDPNPLGVNT